MGGEQQQVIVTGAALGLGRSIADGFLGVGAQVAGIDILDEISRGGRSSASGARGMASSQT